MCQVVLHYYADNLWNDGSLSEPATTTIRSCYLWAPKILICSPRAVSAMHTWMNDNAYNLTQSFKFILFSQPSQCPLQLESTMNSIRIFERPPLLSNRRIRIALNSMRISFAWQEILERAIPSANFSDAGIDRSKSTVVGTCVADMACSNPTSLSTSSTLIPALQNCRNLSRTGWINWLDELEFVYLTKAKYYGVPCAVQLHFPHN